MPVTENRPDQAQRRPGTHLLQIAGQTPKRRHLVPRSGLLLLTCVLGLVNSAEAHPISMSDAVIHVDKTGVTVELSVLAEDLVLYYSVKASDEGVFPAQPLRTAANRHQEFLLKDLTLRDEEGNRLSGTLERIDAGSISDDGVPQTDIKQKSVTYRFQFAVKKPLRFLTVTQRFGGNDAVLPSIMDCMILQNEALIEKPQTLLAGQPLTVKLDWENPPKKPANWRELREQRQKRLKERLGIASYSGLYSFIYITDYQVRHEILVPLLTLESWLPIERKQPEFLSVDEQQQAAKNIARFFRKHSQVSIDGSPVHAEIDRLSFFGLDISDFALNAKPRRIGVPQGRVGIILSYPAKSTPNHVQVTWDSYSEFAPFVRSVVCVFDEAPRETFFREDEATFEWTREKERPVRSWLPVPRVTGQKPSPADAKRISESLLQNLYRAFDNSDEEKTYDALAQSVDGPLLRDIYLQIRRSLIMQEQGGSRSRVIAVVPKRTAPKGLDSATSLQRQCVWQVTGTVEHWGHIHRRVSEYSADVSMSATKGGWRITALKITRQRRVRFETTLRGRKPPSQSN